MSGIISSPGFSGGRQGVMKEKITDVATVRAEIKVPYVNERKFDDNLNELIEKGYLPVPNSFSSDGNIACILMMKTEMKVEMV